MAKLCPRGKAAAKAKFAVYPSAYANMYASGVCSGKIVPGGFGVGQTLIHGKLFTYTSAPAK